MIRVVHDLLINSLNKFENKTAAYLKKTEISYINIYNQSIKLARMLLSLGTKKGDRIAFFLEKRFEKIISIFGISMSGGVMVPISRLDHAHQVLHIVNNSTTRNLITTYDRFLLLKDIFKETGSIKKIILIDVENRQIENIEEIKNIEIIKWDQGSAEDKDLPGVIPSDNSAILYTSGSTGKPKGVVVSHSNVVTGAFTVSEYLKINSDDKLLSILPFNFDYGLNQLTSSFLHGAQIVLLDSLFTRDIINAIKTYQITGLAAVAATWLQLLQIKWDKEDVKTLRYITNSGGAIPEESVKELIKRLPAVDIYLMYGLTEAFRSTYLDPKQVSIRPTSMGKAIPGEEIMILNENNEKVKSGETGELVHRGPLVAQGYWNERELTDVRYKLNPLQSSEIPIKEIVVYSGDLVQIDNEGYLYFKGRKDEMIKSAGHRISPTEVEEIIYNSGLVKENVAFGVPHEIYGQTVAIVLVPENKNAFDKDELLKFCRKMMPPYMNPSHLFVWNKLPTLPNGKINRSKIKKDTLESF